MVKLERGKDLDGGTCREGWTWRKGGTWRDRKELGWGEEMGSEWKELEGSQRALGRELEEGTCTGGRE